MWFQGLTPESPNPCNLNFEALRPPSDPDLQTDATSKKHRVWGLGSFRVWGLGFRVWGSEQTPKPPKSESPVTVAENPPNPKSHTRLDSSLWTSKLLNRSTARGSPERQSSKHQATPQSPYEQKFDPPSGLDPKSGDPKFNCPLQYNMI